jgi:hypothetical protein
MNFICKQEFGLIILLEGIKMINYQKAKSIHALMMVFLGSICLSLFSSILLAQEGHPLTGSWSGNRNIDNDRTRVLLLLDLEPNQVISGTIIENGKRIPLTEVILDHESWAVKISAVATDEAGDAVDYEINGVLENLGSATQRAIVGTWREGSSSGGFRLNIN